MAIDGQISKYITGGNCYRWPCFTIYTGLHWSLPNTHYNTGIAGYRYNLSATVYLDGFRQWAESVMDGMDYGCCTHTLNAIRNFGILYQVVGKLYHCCQINSSEGGFAGGQCKRQ